jgi:hypothetical protein
MLEEENFQIEWQRIIRSQQELLDFEQQEVDRLKLEIKNLKKYKINNKKDVN